MSPSSLRHVYGPVPSRRLGRSLGVDLVPHKTCTYDCLYCQLGRTTCRTLERREYVPTKAVIQEIGTSLQRDSHPDFIALAGAGEPTLHSGLQDIVEGIKALTSIPVAVITNGSLLWMREVSRALMGADVVLPSLDAGDPAGFQRINRPHEGIGFERMLEGLGSFTRAFPGEVWLEVFLLAAVNDDDASVARIAELARAIDPARVQLNTIARPPAEPSAIAPSPERMRRIQSAFSGRADLLEEGLHPDREIVCGIDDDTILALLERRPCTVEGVASGLGIHRMEALKILERLNADGRVTTLCIGQETFHSLARQGLTPKESRT